jgi:hypothetical protein
MTYSSGWQTFQDMRSHTYWRMPDTWTDMRFDMRVVRCLTYVSAYALAQMLTVTNI